MKDLFSSHPDAYAQFRPTYPDALFDFIYQYVRQFDVAWDAGTGNGQAARKLSEMFRSVYATDISSSQIAQAWKAENIFYSIAGEQASFTDHSVDLITVAQAAHWFDMNVFSREVIRVLKPGGIIAVWGYGLLSINNDIDPLIKHFYKDVIGPYWDEERRHIDEQYANLYFPFQEISSPSFAIETEWTLSALNGYLTTWSAVKRYEKKHDTNPVEELMTSLRYHWNAESVLVRFPVFLKLGKVA